MKVLLVNGSPHQEGCTYTALQEIAKTLSQENIDSEIFWLGTKPIMSCIACGKCYETKRCLQNDKVNEFLDKVESTDGFIFGSPVHYAAASGQITSFLGRVFYAKDTLFHGKPGAAIVSCRRGGAASTFDQLNKYFTIAQMPVVSSQYWNMVHGRTPEDVFQDKEGLQTMRTLARNMAWMIKCFALGKAQGITFPTPEPKVQTHFIQ